MDSIGLFSRYIKLLCCVEKILLPPPSWEGEETRYQFFLPQQKKVAKKKNSIPFHQRGLLTQW